jgi:hypothetical protein
MLVIYEASLVSYKVCPVVLIRMCLYPVLKGEFKSVTCAEVFNFLHVFEVNLYFLLIYFNIHIEYLQFSIWAAINVTNSFSWIELSAY